MKTFAILLTLFSCLMLQCQEIIRSALILEEGFENQTFPPEGWLLYSTGAGFSQELQAEGVLVHGGSYSVVHWDDSGFQDDWLISPLISVPATNSTTFSFWQNGWWVGYYYYHEVCVSTDLINWNQIYSGFPPLGEGQGNVWEQIILSLNDYKGKSVYIGFHYLGDYNDQWFIDDINIFNHSDIPQNVAITEISNNSVLSWDLVPNAESYSIYSTTDPYASFPVGWSLEGSGITETTWTDFNTINSKKFYTVVAVRSN